MNHAVHQVIFDNDNYQSNMLSNLINFAEDGEEGLDTIDFSALMPVPSNKISVEEIRNWCLENWKNAANPTYVEVVDDHLIEFETDNAPCQPFIKLWAEKYNFTGQYRAISSDLKEWVEAHFTDGVIDLLKENEEVDLNTLCYELRGFNYFEVLDREDTQYTNYLAQVISYHSDFKFVMDGLVAKFSKGSFAFDFSYDCQTDRVSVVVNGQSLVSDPLHSDLHPSGILERYVDDINAIYKKLTAA